MFSRILVKLVDEAIVPAIVLFSVRILAAILIAKAYDISFSFGLRGFTYNSQEDFLFVNSYSTLAMISVLAVGLFYVLIKSYLFHDTHVAPHTAAKLFSLNLSGFIQTSFDVYSQGVIWLSYSYLLVIASGIMFYFGLVYPWVFYSSLALTFIATLLLILDVEKEIFERKRDAGSQEEVTLKFESMEEEL
uniref:Uncharacterized protein n=1 Tax=candidate division WWE3 bacterium TaxID=2053526 RepID=A0A7C4TLU7_UNCKA